MTATSVDRIYSDIAQLLSLLSTSGEISLLNSANDTYRKSLLLSIASYFEAKLSRTVLEFVEEQTCEKHIVVSLVKTKVINRQYHTWFEWERNNANSFFALFGAEFKEKTTEVIKGDPLLSASIKSFLELGRDRNRLVHQDYASFSLEKTSDEIYQYYKSALRFIEWVPIALKKYAVPTETQE